MIVTHTQPQFPCSSFYYVQLLRRKKENAYDKLVYDYVHKNSLISRDSVLARVLLYILRNTLFDILEYEIQCLVL